MDNIWFVEMDMKKIRMFGLNVGYKEFDNEDKLMDYIKENSYDVDRLLIELAPQFAVIIADVLYSIKNGSIRNYELEVKKYKLKLRDDTKEHFIKYCTKEDDILKKRIYKQGFHFE